MKLLYDLLQPDLREDGGEVVLPVLQGWLLSCSELPQYVKIGLLPAVSCHSMSGAMFG